MQTPAEKALVACLAQTLRAHRSDERSIPRILSIGAGKSLAIENELSHQGLTLLSDRVDVEDCRVDDPRVAHCWICPVEAMTPVPSAAYDVAFANYVFEHVTRPKAAAEEVFRILKPGGVFAASLPNPKAPEFRLAASTPTWFHRWVRGETAWETRYAYGDIEALVQMFVSTGFDCLRVEKFAFLEGYLGRFRGLGTLARAYDRAAMGLRAEFLLGNVFLAFVKKSSPGG